MNTAKLIIKIKELVDKPAVIWLARIVVGVMFIFSAFSKLVGIGQFEITMIQQSVVDDRSIAAYLARIVIIVELALGLCYFQRHYIRRIVLPATTLILVGFTVYLSYLAIFTDYEDNCGCFGDLIQMSPLEAIIKNLVVLVVVFFLFAKIKPDPVGGWLLPLGLSLGTTLAIFIAYPVDIVDQNDVAQVPVSGPNQSADNSKHIPAAESRFAIFDNAEFKVTEGQCIVAFLSLECDHCRDTARELGALPKSDSTPIYFIFFGEEEAVPEFFSDTMSQFPYILASPDDFFDLIGNAPPRVYLLSQGAILKFWDLDNFSINEIASHL